MSSFGYVDCNWFRMRTRKGSPNLFNAQTAVEARYYDEALLAKTIMAKGPANDKKVVVEAPNGSTVTFNRVSFSRECRYWKLKASSQAAGATVGLFVDDDLETPLAVITIPSGAGNQVDTYTAAIKPLSGIHKITLRSTTSDNGSILIDKLSFSPAK